MQVVYLRGCSRIDFFKTLYGKGFQPIA